MTPPCPTCEKSVTNWPATDCETPEAHVLATYGCDCGDVVTVADVIDNPRRHRRCHLIGASL